MKLLALFFVFASIYGPSCLSMKGVSTKVIPKAAFVFPVGTVNLVDTALGDKAEVVALLSKGSLTFNRLAHRKGHPVAVYHKPLGKKASAATEFTFVTYDVLEKLLAADEEAEFRELLKMPLVATEDSGYLVWNVFSYGPEKEIIPVKVKASIGLQTLMNLGLIDQPQRGAPLVDRVNYWIVSVGQAEK